MTTKPLDKPALEASFEVMTIVQSHLNDQLDYKI